MDTSKDYYKILEISSDSNELQLKAAFRRMVKLYSPDVNHDPSAMEKFENILEAWEVLGRPSSRVEYDMLRGIWHGDMRSWSSQQDTQSSRPPSYHAQNSNWQGGSGFGSFQSSGFGGFQSTGFGGVPYSGGFSGSQQRTSSSPRSSGTTPPRREAERRRVAEERRRIHQDEVQGYFESGVVLISVVISFILLACVGLFTVTYSGNPNLSWANCIVSAMVFTLLFWIGFWMLSMFVRPSEMDAEQWSALSGFLCALIFGSMYGFWMAHMMNEGAAAIKLILWGGPFLLIFFLVPMLVQKLRN